MKRGKRGRPSNVEKDLDAQDVQHSEYANKLVKRNALLRERRKLEAIIRGIDLEIETLERKH